MKHVCKLGALMSVLVAIWIGLLLHIADLPAYLRSLVPYLPVYALVTLGCYGLAMVGYGLMVFPHCPEEAILLQKDVLEAKAFLSSNGIDVKLPAD